MTILSRIATFAVLFTVGCDPVPAPADAGPDDAGSGPEPVCVTPSGALPRALALPSVGDFGVFDVSLAKAPDDTRVWLSYSTVNRLPDAVRPHDVNTMIGYTDDNGATFCATPTLLNASTPVDPAPPGLAGNTNVWNHEVSDLVYDDSAPADARFKLVWMEYVVSNEVRRFELGWLAMRQAASVEALAAAPVHKWLAGTLYDLPEVRAFNDAQGGAPETRITDVDPRLDCAVLSEPALLSDGDALYLAFLCARIAPAPNTIELIAKDAGSNAWRAVGTLLEPSDGDVINPVIDLFSAPELVRSGGDVYLLATPQVGETYRGCVGYRVDLANGTLEDTAPADGIPDPVFAVQGEAAFNGACAFDEALPDVGVIINEGTFDADPWFHLSITGQQLP